ncbi:hypothetical protein D3C71_1650240 [compost metagenome]
MTDDNRMPLERSWMRLPTRSRVKFARALRLSGLSWMSTMRALVCGSAPAVACSVCRTTVSAWAAKGRARAIAAAQAACLIEGMDNSF